MALETAQAVPRDRLDNARSRALYSVAYYQAETGDDRTSFDWAINEANKYVRARALLGVAEGMLARKQAELTSE